MCAFCRLFFFVNAVCEFQILLLIKTNNIIFLFYAYKQSSATAENKKCLSVCVYICIYICFGSTAAQLPEYTLWLFGANESLSAQSAEKALLPCLPIQLYMLSLHKLINKTIIAQDVSKIYNRLEKNSHTSPQCLDFFSFFNLK